ncbi:MAG: hypothetical protein ACPL68_05955, partial [Candidatus Hydrothermia bacterium]
MKDIRRIAEERPEWVSATGLYSETVIYSGVEVARSLAGVKFWPKAGIGKGKQKRAASRAIATAFGPEARFSEPEKSVMSVIWEKYPYMKGASIVFSGRGGLHVSVGPRETLRFYSYSGGAISESVFSRATEAAESAGRAVEFAYDPELGFLNPNLEEVGSGLCFRALLHLPGMTHTDELVFLRESLERTGVKTNGFFRGWPKPRGCLVNITYRPGPGVCPADAQGSFHEIILFVIDQEKEARSVMVASAEAILEDRAMRALATLGAARVMGYEELADMISWVRLGIAIGALEPMPVREMNA